MRKFILLFTGISGAKAVALGALGAHGLSGRLSPTALSSFDTALTYHIWHTLALAAALLLMHVRPARTLPAAAVCFMAGMVLFSGSLYLLSTREVTGIAGMDWLGPVTPLGGLLLIAGWLLLAASSMTGTKDAPRE